MRAFLLLLVSGGALAAEATGIATRHPGDVGIANDPAVLFVEDFESPTIEAMNQRWTEAKNPANEVFAFSAKSADPRFREIVKGKCR